MTNSLFHSMPSFSLSIQLSNRDLKIFFYYFFFNSRKHVFKLHAKTMS